MIKAITFFITTLCAILLLSSCNKKEQVVPTVPVLGAEAVPVVPVPGADEAAPAAVVLSADGVPVISKEVEYPAYRKSLMQVGWTPVKQGGQCGFVCQGYRTEGYKETEDCGDAGLAPCTFIFKNKDDVILKVNTAGENLAVTRALKGVSSKSAEASAPKIAPVARQESRPVQLNQAGLQAECKKAITAQIPKTRNYGGAIGIAQVQVSSVQIHNQIYAVIGAGSANPYKPEYGNNNFLVGTAITKDTSMNPQMKNMGSFVGAYTFDCVFSPDGTRFMIRNLASQ